MNENRGCSSRRGSVTELTRLVIFSILMENGDGIIDKSPEYVLEKFHSAKDVPYPTELLDWSNKRKFKRYCELWILPPKEAQE